MQEISVLRILLFLDRSVNQQIEVMCLQIPFQNGRELALVLSCQFTDSLAKPL